MKPFLTPGLKSIQNKTISKNSTADENSQKFTYFTYLGAKLDSHRHTGLKPCTGALSALFKNKTQAPELALPKDPVSTPTRHPNSCVTAGLGLGTVVLTLIAATAITRGVQRALYPAE
ncbi:hypothetical protein NPX13_g1059 [Xylaria arbuscula]|uniref:Uncharacterized protein n=1 Tax=Xylaria arbuscula TaxID=114810 RepID=A0A9W8NMR8_9PEZI|nr:hypothetical protein NPX13_g1059 [Xylaria arbuscula]